MLKTLRWGLVVVAVAACAGPAPAPTPTPSAEGLYLRAWLEQALPPEHTFAWLPPVTIVDDLLIDGQVAVPAIFPGPLTVMPHAQRITDAGQLQVIEQASQLGLLSGETDFTGGGLAPGAQTAHLVMVVGNVTYRLTGDPLAPAAAQPGGPSAFALFWQRVTTLGEWLATELGPPTAYAPEQLAVALVTPQAQADVEPNRVAWPLGASFAETGRPWALPGSRCATFAGGDLEALLPVLRSATQIDVFVDAVGEERGLIVRPLVPGDPSPCGDEA